MDDITNRTTALLALLSFQEEEIPSCWVLTSGNVNHLLVLHSSFFFLFPLVVSRCQSEPSKLITPVGSQPKRWEFYRFPPALLYVVCVCVYIYWVDGLVPNNKSEPTSRRDSPRRLFSLFLFLLLFLLLSEDGPPQNFLSFPELAWESGQLSFFFFILLRNSREHHAAARDLPKSSRTWYTHREQSVDYRLMHTETLHHYWWNRLAQWTSFELVLRSWFVYCRSIHTAVFLLPEKLRYCKDWLLTFQIVKSLADSFCDKE